MIDEGVESFAPSVGGEPMHDPVRLAWAQATIGKLAGRLEARRVAYPGKGERAIEDSRQVPAVVLKEVNDRLAALEALEAMMPGPDAPEIVVTGRFGSGDSIRPEAATICLRRVMQDQGGRPTPATRIFEFTAMNGAEELIMHLLAGIDPEGGVLSFYNTATSSVDTWFSVGAMYLVPNPQTTVPSTA